jgi:alpha-tubulin suppressor-like RCC1 family protein
MASQYRTIALKKNGTLWAWGNNESGQLGDGTTINKTSPAQVLTDTNWSKIAAGGTHTVALKVNGTLWAWGMNDYGQLGDGTTISKTTPTRIGTANNWSRIAAGRTHTLGIKMDGTLWAWGNNEWGKLGDGTSGVLNSKKSPGKIGNASDWSKIVAGRAHTFALTKEGKLWTWGDCYYGQLGLGDAMWRAAPTRVGKATSTDWKEIAAGANHNLAIKTDGSLWAWGHNGNGQLGLGDTYNRHAPTLVK